MGMPAARVTDLHTCPMVTGLVPHVGGPILPPCAVNVLIGNLPAARVGDLALCAGGPDTIVKGSLGVFINGQPAARIGDLTVHGGVITTGLPSVLIGDIWSGGGAGAGGASGAAARTQASGPIADPAVQAGMRAAWTASQASDPANRHEEGGYIVRNADGSLGVEPWPRGSGASIAPPARAADGSYNGKQVLGEFHTHPNPPVDENGKKWTQGGHPGDWNGVAAEKYPGDSYIISDGHIYKIDSAGKPTNDKAGNEVPMGTRTDLIGP